MWSLHGSRIQDPNLRVRLTPIKAIAVLCRVLLISSKNFKSPNPTSHLNTEAMSPSKITEHPTYKIASIPADGIGLEVISAGITVLKKLASILRTFDLEFENFDWSSDRYKKTGKYLPDDALQTLKKFDAILFGAVGAPGESLVPKMKFNLLIYNQMSQTTSPSGASA